MLNYNTECDNYSSGSEDLKITSSWDDHRRHRYEGVAFEQAFEEWAQEQSKYYRQGLAMVKPYDSRKQVARKTKAIAFREMDAANNTTI